MKLNKQTLLRFVIVFLFVISRWFIFSNPPPYYSDVKADYERYANMWRYGTPPYLKHLYEYPPATIPMLSIPLSLDQAGYGKYYPNYRTEILLIDAIFFGYLVWLVGKIPWLNKRQFESLLVYIILTTLAKDFFYEGIDLAFTASATISFTLLYFISPKRTAFKNMLIETVIWTFFWLSVGIKFLTLPLALPLALFLHRGKIVQQIGTCIIGFFIVWGLPIAIYRSSLQVMFVHNNDRPIKYASFPAYLIKWANVFTHSEQQHMVAPDFEYQGPVSTQVTKINKAVFPVIIITTILAMTTLIVLKTFELRKLSLSTVQEYFFHPKKLSEQTQLSLMLWFYTIYIFVLFVSAKIFSQPFHIWYIAPLVLLPFKKKSGWYFVIALCTLMILLDMTTLLHIKNNFLVFGVVEIGLIRDMFRFIPMFIILVVGVHQLRMNKELN